MKKVHHLRVNSARIQQRSTSKITSPTAVKSSRIENYFPIERKYKSPLIGEVILNRSIHNLSTISLDNSTILATTLPAPIKFTENQKVNEFFEVASTPLRQRPNYQRAMIRSLKDLLSIQYPTTKLLDLPIAIPNKPYGHPDSRRFLGSCKDGNTTEILSFLTLNPNLVYTFDDLHMTGLHWTALRNHIPALKILLLHHSMIDATDINHRTALFIAARKGHLEAVKLLLLNNANIMIASNSHKTPIKVAKNPLVHAVLKKVYTFYNISQGMVKKPGEAYYKENVLFYLNAFK